MTAVTIIFTILQVLSGLAVTVIVLMQSGKSAGLSFCRPDPDSEPGVRICESESSFAGAKGISFPRKSGMRHACRSSLFSSFRLHDRPQTRASVCSAPGTSLSA